MSQFEIEVKGLEELIAKLNGTAPKVIGDITMAVGQLVRDAMAKEPKARTGPVKWASAKQRSWYHWARAKNVPPLPLQYTRNSDPWSQRLGPSWAVERWGQMDAAVGTRVTYAKWVQSEEFQQPMHEATGWKTDKDAVEEVRRSGAVERIVSDVVKKEW